MDIFMILSFVIGAGLLVSILSGIIKGIKDNSPATVIYCILILPFWVFMSSSILLGGSAFNDAAADYELYEAGHFYLVNHGSYTEVTEWQYNYMKLTEIVGLATFIIDFLFILVLNALGKKK